jgi:SPP1 gp7 family putative phage head morphogenesis protein
MAEELKAVVWTTPTGEALRSFLASQTHLITSIPLEAAERAQALALQTFTEGSRGEDFIEEMMRIAGIARWRAELIARTEVSRTASGLTQVRAESIGSEGYIWRTANDSLVRPAHKKLEGRYFKWNKPPIAGNGGMRGHPGQTPNCRCFAEVVIPKAAKQNKFIAA